MLPLLCRRGRTVRIPTFAILRRHSSDSKPLPSRTIEVGQVAKPDGLRHGQVETLETPPNSSPHESVERSEYTDSVGPSQRSPCPLLVFDLHAYDWIPTKGRVRNNQVNAGMLKFVSWDIDGARISPGRRVSTILNHLEGRFGNNKLDLVVMFHDVNPIALEEIRSHDWVRRNYILSDTKAETYPHTLILVPHSIGAFKCWDIRFPSDDKWGNTIFVDVPVHNSEEALPSALRICTTQMHAGPIKDRPRLNQISSLLKETATEYTIIGGLVGSRHNHKYAGLVHDQELAGLGLKDAWDDSFTTPAVLANYAKDDGPPGSATCMQLSSSRKPRRITRFLYTGPMKAFPIRESLSKSGVIGKLGLGSRVGLEVWKEIVLTTISPEINIEETRYYTDEWGEKHPTKIENMQRAKFHTSVSRHYGIAVGMKVLP